MNHPVSAWFLVGCTAVGKTPVSQLLAEQMRTAVLSTDAMLVYRGMDIGTAKPTPTERGGIPYMGIDLVDPDRSFSVGAWLTAVKRQIAERGSASDTTPTPLIVTGGTGLYVKALISGFESAAPEPRRQAHWQRLLDTRGTAGLRDALRARDPTALAQLSDPDNPRRLMRALERLDVGLAATARWPREPLPVLAGLRLSREQLHARIAERVARMFASGLAEEVRLLRKRFPSWSATAGQAIGYAEACAWLDGRLSRAEAMERTVIRTRQLARRQETWYRHQLRVEWIDIDADSSPAALAPRVLEVWRKHGPCPIHLF